ncbi:MAG: isopentenyl-diphosphate Delta-isomerase [Patescibacteria group bacterium]|jgi:isopentenyl-diphosphate delta-isomerase
MKNPKGGLKKLKRNIISAVEEALKVKILGIEETKNGSINHVYKIRISTGNYIVRVFNFENWPENGKLEWIEKELSQRGISHARLLYFTRDKKYFPHGFMVAEYAKGIDGAEAAKKGLLSYEKSYFEKGKILRKIHEIKVKNFGPLNKGKGKSPDFIGYKLKRADRFLKRMVSNGLLKPGISKKMSLKVRQAFEPFAKDFTPVLVHGDATGKNTIWTKGKGLLLIDWDNAWSGIWLWDFIELSWWWRHLKSWQDAKKQEVARQAFFRGYGKISYDKSELKALEYGLHLIKSAERMHYFYYDLKKTDNFNRVRRIFLEDLAKTAPYPERLVLLDAKNREKGSEEKIKAHEKGLRHRAFSALVFNRKGELLLQKRSRKKHHSGGTWSNTCCSHPRPGESVVAAGERRLREEMGFSCKLKECFSFNYRAKLERGLIENEHDHVLIGRYDGKPVINQEEAEDWQWIKLDELKKEVKNNPEKFSVWLKIMLPKLMKYL